MLSDTGSFLFVKAVISLFAFHPSLHSVDRELICRFLNEPESLTVTVLVDGSIDLRWYFLVVLSLVLDFYNRRT